MQNQFKCWIQKKIYFIGLCFFILMSGCNSKKIGTTTSVEPHFNSIYSQILSKNCVQCHAPGASATVNNATQIDFSSKDSSYNTLTTLSSSGLSSNLSGQCNGVPLIQKFSPNDSYLLATLSTSYYRTNFYKNGCTPYAPETHGATVSSSDVSAIADWIQNGALND